MTPYEKIHLMNTLIGHKGVNPESSEFWKQIRNQTERVVEEVEETLDAAIDEDALELLDGISDIMVTAIGLYQKLQQCGYPVDEAFNRVCDNNLTKFHKDPNEANKTVEFYKNQGVETFVRLIRLESGEEFYSVIRKSDGKLLKPYNFEPVDLLDLAMQVSIVAEEWENKSKDEPTE